MRSTLVRVTLVIPALIVSFGAISASPCIAQTRVTSLEELQRELAAGDFVTIVPGDGQPVAGRLMRLGNADLDIRLVNRRTPRSAAREMSPSRSMPFSRSSGPATLREMARLSGPASARGSAEPCSSSALVIDRNEMDEWAPFYVGAAAVCTGIGALIGWAMDAASSKPHIRFDPSSGGRTKVSVQPVYSRGRGIALAVSFSR